MGESNFVPIGVEGATISGGCANTGSRGADHATIEGHRGE